MKTARWLHLTDLHAGMRTQGWLWPTFETEFLSDLARIHERSGPWDFILFSGDMVRAGQTSEFDIFTQICEMVLSKAKDAGSECKIVTLPGNHDLMRPSEIDPHYVSLMQFQRNSALSDDFWNEDRAGNRQFVVDRFASYMDWRSAAISKGLHVAPTQEGYLPGDASYIVDGQDGQTRIAALNSTWLQLAGGDFKKRLIIDPRQFLSITENQPDSWFGAADFAILATHQGSDWLTTDAEALWQSEIYPPGRFDLHACGHMHRASSRIYSAAGSASRREVLGASLFGMEEKNAEWERVQGYASYTITRQDERRVLQGWPRLLQKMQNGENKLKPDNTYDLDEISGSYSIEYSRTGIATSGIISKQSGDDPFVSDTKELRFKLANIEINLPTNIGFAETRLAEQQQAEGAWLADARAFWLASDWGMGTKPFLETALSRTFDEPRRVFRLDVGKFSDKSSFLDQVRVTYGTSYEEICDEIERAGNSLIIFDEPPLSSLDVETTQKIISELESLVLVTKDYLPSGVFCVISRVVSRGFSIPAIELKPFDEPDTRLYIRAHSSSESHLHGEVAVERIFKLTDGHPARLDTTLRQLQVVSLDELALTNSDLDATLTSEKSPAALNDVIIALREGSEAGERAFSFLSALAEFPGGERFDTVKRFTATSQYHPAHATALLDRGLIDSVSFSRMGDQSNANSFRLLVVPRSVRECVRTRLSAEDTAFNDRRALEIYFGDGWRSGLASSAAATKIAENPLAAPYELLNANTILLRTILRASDNENALDMEGALRIISAFISRQRSGGHYRNALALCDEVIPIIKDRYASQNTYLRIERARCLRMIGRHTDARDEFLNIDLTGVTRAIRQEVALGLAMSHQGAGDQIEATKAAENALALNQKSMTAHHARILLAQMKPHSTMRTKELIDLKNKAAARKWHVLENNVNMFLANRQNSIKKNSMLRQVIDNAQKHGDFYNKFRATLDIMENRKPGDTVVLGDRLSLISAYHFFHNERLGDFFRRVHSILWTIFEEEADFQNLLSLFRHSSFIWRLSGDSDTERSYLDRLRSHLNQIQRSNLARISRDRTYFLVRVQAAATE